MFCPIIAAPIFVLSAIPNTVPLFCEEVIVWLADAVLVSKIPVVGSCILVAPVVVKVSGFAPLVVKVSAKVTFFPVAKLSSPEFKDKLPNVPLLAVIVLPFTAFKTTFPAPSTVKGEELPPVPTLKSPEGVAVPIPTFPPLKNDGLPEIPAK